MKIIGFFAEKCKGKMEEREEFSWFVIRGSWFVIRGSWSMGVG